MSNKVPVGALRFNTESNKLEYFDGTRYVNITTSSAEQNSGTRGGVASGGYSGPAPMTRIEQVNIATTGNAVNFGETSAGNYTERMGGSNHIYGFFAGGYNSTNPIGRFTIAIGNDGIDFGEALSIQITINNTGPSAVITPPESLVEGAVVTFSASESTDLDGTVVNAIWSVDGEVVHSGLAFDYLMTNQLDLTVRVIDNLGAFDITSSVFIGEKPPTASSVDAKIDDSIVKISWSGQAESWAIVHNGDFIDSTNTTRYEHAPVIEGNHTSVSYTHLTLPTNREV